MCIESLPPLTDKMEEELNWLYYNLKEEALGASEHERIIRVLRSQQTMKEEKSSIDLSYWLDRFKRYWHLNCPEDEFKTGEIAYNQIRKLIELSGEQEETNGSLDR